MKEYIIDARELNTEEKKEIYQMLQSIGYQPPCSKFSPHGGWRKLEYILTFKNGSIEWEDEQINKNDYSNHVPLTISELRAMASTEKEYINKTTGEYRKTADVVSGEQWVEIPSGANIYALANDGLKTFWSDDYQWLDGKITRYIKKEDPKYTFKEWALDWNASILWQRPTQPESLPFVDDEPSLNDQYAEIEQVRQGVINKPNHYNGTECLDAMQKMMTHEQFIGFLRGNVFKYQWRYDKKNGLEDLKKSQWYLDKLMSLL